MESARAGDTPGCAVDDVAVDIELMLARESDDSSSETGGGEGEVEDEALEGDGTLAEFERRALGTALPVRAEFW